MRPYARAPAETTLTAMESTRTRPDPALPELLPMLRSQLEALRAWLRSEIERKTREIATPTDDRGEDLTVSQHPADVAGDLTAREDEIALELGFARELEAVDAALERIADGTYGTCVDCGTAIPIERLVAQPRALRDIVCERRFERR